MTKSELIEEIARRSNLTRSRAEEVVHCVLESMAEALARGEGIEIRGFGSFTVRSYKPYTGRNPRTNEVVNVGAKRLPFFKVGKELRDLVNSRAGTPLPEDHDPHDAADDDADDGHDDDEQD